MKSLVALAAIDFLASIIAPRTAHDACFDRLAIDDRYTRLRMTPDLDTGSGMQGSVELVPQPLQAPQPEVMVDRPPRGQIMWCRKFGQQYANQLHRRRPQPGDKWHLDEVFLTMNGERHYLWRAVDQGGNILEMLVQRRRDQTAAKKFIVLPIKPRGTGTE